MKITSVADLTAKQVSYAPEIDKTQRPTPPQGESTPEVSNPTIKQGETTPTISNPIINQGSTTPDISNPIIQQGETTPTLSNPNIIQGETTPTLPNYNIIQGETTPTLSNPNIIQGETTPTLSNPNIIQGETTPTLSNPNIQQGSTDPIITIPNIQQGDTTPTPSNPTINQGETTPTITNPIINQGETTPTVGNPNINQGSTTPIPSNPVINQGSTDPISLTPTINQGNTTPTPSNPTINQGSTTPTPSNPTINQGSTTPTPSNPTINQGSTTPTPSNPTINQGSTTPTPSNPTINQGSTTPTPSNPTINQGSTTPTPSNPTINQGSTTPSPSNPTINQGSTTPSVLTPNINQGSTTPTPSNPTINQGSTTPTPSNPTINQGSTTPTPSNPTINQGSTTPTPSNPTINQGSTTPTPSNPTINQGSTTPSVITPNINQGSTTPVTINPNINQGSTTPVATNPNIRQGSTTPVATNPNIQQGSTTPVSTNPNIVQGSTTVATSGWQDPSLGTRPSENYAKNVLRLSSQTYTSVLNSIRAAEAVQPELFTTPIIGESINSLAGINIPIIGGSSIGPVLSGLANAAGLGDAASIALYLASLPLTLYKRADGILLVGSMGATVAYVHSQTNKRRQFDTAPGGSINNTFDLISIGKSLLGLDNEDSTAQHFTTTPEDFIPYERPDSFIGGIGPNGGPAEESGVNSAGLSWNTLPYYKLAERAAIGQGQVGIPITPGYYYEINKDAVEPDPSSTKDVSRRYTWYKATEQSSIDPVDVSTQDQPYIVDEMMSTLFDEDIEDYIKFSFKDLRTDEKFQFRSYLENISDKFNPTWQDITYIGRPNPLKLFTSVTRDVSLDFIVPALNRGELQMMYNKLTRLARLTMPTGVGIMQAPMMEFTIGDWFVNEVGHLTNLSFTVENDYTWEINNERGFVELPQIIKVSMGIFIIGTTAMETKTYRVFGPNAYDNEWMNNDIDKLTYASNPNNPNNDATQTINK